MSIEHATTIHCDGASCAKSTTAADAAATWFPVAVSGKMTRHACSPTCATSALTTVLAEVQKDRDEQKARQEQQLKREQERAQKFEEQRRNAAAMPVSPPLVAKNKSSL